MEARLHEEGRAAGLAEAQPQIKALRQARAEAQTAAQHQIHALLQERDDLQASGTSLLTALCCNSCDCCMLFKSSFISFLGTRCANIRAWLPAAALRDAISLTIFEEVVYAQQIQHAGTM